MRKKDLYQEWVNKAEKDLKRAQKAMILRDFEDVCFHSHQAVEKFLKALLVYYRMEVPKTHNLPQLGEILGQKVQKISNFTDDMTVIDSYYLPSRYPLEVEETVTTATAKQILEKSKRVIDFIKTQLPKGNNAK